MTEVCKKAIVRGDVQGVGFRFSTRKQADSHGIRGWAKNLDDGNVEVVMSGEEDDVDNLIEWLHWGPSMASVESVDVEVLPKQKLTGFKIG